VSSGAKEKESGLRIAQVVAAALAAVTAALLGSTIGVAGTVAGAGLASIITTVGGELYLRSLRKTRVAARRAREALGTTPFRRRAALSEAPTGELPRPGTDTDTAPPEDKRLLRWALIFGLSAVAFVVALLAIVGFEQATGTQVGGGTGPAIGRVLGGDHPTSTPSHTPVTSVTPTTPATPSGTTPPPTTSSAPPTTTSSAPPSTTTPGTTSSPTPTSGQPTP